MNAEQMELARRFVACKGWGWLPGMLAPRRGRVFGVDGETLYFAGTDGRFNGKWEVYQCLPDLSDALTRAGLLEVVRRAWRDPDAYVRPSTKGGYVLCSRVCPGGPTRGEPPRGPSELHALLAALEAAPGV